MTQKTQIEQTAARRKDVAQSGNYDIYIEIDCDCEELRIASPLCTSSAVCEGAKPKKSFAVKH